MASPGLKKASIILAVILICGLMLPITGVSAGNTAAIEGDAAGSQSFAPQNIHISEDAVKRNPRLEKLLKAYLENTPKELVPESIKDMDLDGASVAATAGGSAEAGAGTGGWTPLAGAYTPSADAAIDYDFRIGEERNQVDSNGVMHSIITITTLRDIHQPIDGGTLDTPLANMYYVSNTNGTWSAPVPITNATGLEDTYTALWDIDDNGYLHFVYSKFTWGRNLAAGPSIPPNINDYIHLNENYFYRYMSPDGTWSAPRQITSFSGAWGFFGDNFELIGNRVYGSFIAKLNKQVSPDSFTARVSFVEGAFDQWESPHTLRQWDHGWADGDEIPFMSPAFDVSPINGEITAMFATWISQSSPYSQKSIVYGALKSGSGSWSATATLLNSGLNEFWNVPMVVYDENSISSTTLASQSYFAADATHEPIANVYYLDHDSSGWKTFKNMTRMPSKEVTGSIGLSRDPFDNWHIFYSSIHQTWTGVNWASDGGSLHYTYQDGGDPAPVQTVYPYVAGRAAGNISSIMDPNGATHAGFETVEGGNHKVWYIDNTGGSWSTPKQLSTNDGQSIGDWIVVSVSPEGWSLVTWSENRFSGGGVPEIGRICSMLYKNGAWGARDIISEVPGSADLVHIEEAGPEYLNITEGHQGEQLCFFETAKSNPGPPVTYHDFKKYYTASTNGAWSAPELISNINASGEGEMFLDLNNIARITWDFDDAATGKSVLYETQQKQPAPSATTYYFAEGTTREGFQEWLSLQNAGAVEANVTIT